MKTSSYGIVPNRGAITGPHVGGDIFADVGDRKSDGERGRLSCCGFAQSYRELRGENAEVK